MVGFQPGVTEGAKAELLSSVGAREVRRIGNGVHVVSAGEARELRVIQILRANRIVRYAELDVEHRASGGAIPNDANFGNQWGLLNTGQTADGYTGVAGADVKAAPAWSVTTGTNSVVVAVLDSGTQYTHPDLFTNMWSNPGGVGGCPAGTHGYNVLAASCDPMDDEIFFGGHGTHVSGIIGATGNNAAGVSGVNWTTSIMAVKWISSATTGFTSDLITGMDWVIQAKNAGVNVRIVNDSATWPTDTFSQALSDEIDLLGGNDILFVGASGNGGSNLETTPVYPCSYKRPTQICVAGLFMDGSLWVAANYGANTVNLGAPGAPVYSTLRLSNYGYILGGSMAAAMVSGAAALILSNGYQSVSNLRATILASVDQQPSLVGTTTTGGMLDICKALPACVNASTAVPSLLSAPVVTGHPQFGSVVGASTGRWSGLPTSYTYQWSRCNASGQNCVVIPGATNPTYGSFAAADVGSTLAVTVTASNTSGSVSAASSPSAVVTNPPTAFAIASTILDASQIGGSVQWQATPAQAVNYVEFYIDGVLQQSYLTSPYIYNQANTGLLDTSTLAAGSHVLGLRALASDNETFGYYGATVTISSAPVNTALPSISGVPAVGNTLTVSNGTWNNNPTSFAYQWRRCDASGNNCTNISGATSASYVVSSADSNLTLRTVVTATNSFGSSSATSGVVSISVPAITTSSLPVGAIGAAYSSQLAALGGIPPYIWSLASGALPGGLSLSSSGLISGNPTASGTFNFTIKVTDTASQIATKALSITINSSGGGSISLVQSNAIEGTAVGSVTAAFTSNNTAGDLIVAFVRMSSTSQTVSVTDDAGNVYADAVTQGQSTDGHQIHIWYARNIKAGANSVTATFSSTNNHPFLAIYEYAGLSTTAPLDKTAAAQGSSSAVSVGPTATTASANELIFVGAGFPNAWVGTVTSGSSYTLQQQDTGTSRATTETSVVSSPGSYTGSFSLSASANWSAVIATFSAAAAVVPPTVTTSSLPSGTVGSSYIATLTASGGVTPYAWSISAGALPAGLSLSSSSGAISGTPTTAGTNSFTVQVKDANNQTGTASLSIAVNSPALAVTTSSLPAGTVGSAYSATLAASGGTAPYTWSITTGSLPAGLTLAPASGLISGTPTTAGTSGFTVQVKDANNQTATASLSIAVNAVSSIALVQSKATEGSAVSSVSAAFPSANTAGNLIVAVVRMSTATQTVTLSDTRGNAYTNAVSQTQSADGHQIYIFYAKNSKSGSNTIKATFSGTNNHPWIAIYEYKGLSTASPLDTTAKAQGSGAAPATGASTTTVSANELIVAASGYPNALSGTVTAGSGYTLQLQDTATSRAATETQIVSATGSYNGTFSVSTTATWSAVLATFK